MSPDEPDQVVVVVRRREVLFAVHHGDHRGLRRGRWGRGRRRRQRFLLLGLLEGFKLSDKSHFTAFYIAALLSVGLLGPLTNIIQGQVLRNNAGTAIWPKKQSIFIASSIVFGFTLGSQGAWKMQLSVNPYVIPCVNPGNLRLQLAATVATVALLAVSHAAKLALIPGIC